MQAAARTEDLADYVRYAMATGEVGIGDHTEAVEVNIVHLGLKRHKDSEGAKEMPRWLTNAKKDTVYMGRPT